MTREEAIDRLSVAFGEWRDAIRRQAEAIGRMADDMDRLDEAYGKSRLLPKVCLAKTANPTFRPTRSLTE